MCTGTIKSVVLVTKREGFFRIVKTAGSPDPGETSSKFDSDWLKNKHLHM